MKLIELLEEFSFKPKTPPTSKVYYRFEVSYRNKRNNKVFRRGIFKILGNSLGFEKIPFTAQTSLPKPSKIGKKGKTYEFYFTKEGLSKFKTLLPNIGYLGEKPKREYLLNKVEKTFPSLKAALNQLKYEHPNFTNIKTHFIQIRLPKGKIVKEDKYQVVILKDNPNL